MSDACTGHTNPELGHGGGEATPPQAPRRLTPLWALKANYCLGTGSGACLWKFMPVLYSSVGLKNPQIGLIQSLSPMANFCGQIGWAVLCDRLQSYKEVLAISNVLGVATICCCLLPVVNQNFGVLCCVVLGSSAFMASRGSLSDSMTLQVVHDYQDARTLAEQQCQLRSFGSANDSFQLQDAQDYQDARTLAKQLGQTGSVRELPTYGEQRLWGAVGKGFGSLLGGLLMDRLGIGCMFATFSTLLALMVLVIVTQFPSRRPKKVSNVAQGPDPKSFLNFEVLWFFANLLVYGMCMSLVENFLFLFLSREFQGVPNFLLGWTVLVMNMFELPVFLYIHKAFACFGLIRMLSFCHYVFALRCVLYSILPRAQPITVLLVEPLHGITFAIMWSCSVEYGKRLAPEGATAKMQTLVTGLYSQLAIGCGSLLWGNLTQEPPKGFGFSTCYVAAAVAAVAWSLVWNLGWLLWRQGKPGESLLRSETGGETAGLSHP